MQSWDRADVPLLGGDFPDEILCAATICSSVAAAMIPWTLLSFLGKWAGILNLACHAERRRRPGVPPQGLAAPLLPHSATAGHEISSCTCCSVIERTHLPSRGVPNSDMRCRHLQQRSGCRVGDRRPRIMPRHLAECSGEVAPGVPCSLLAGPAHRLAGGESKAA